jgi:Family of unknown function (DUF5318)
MPGRTRLHDSARGVIDYALARRAALSGLASGRLRKTEVCDAQPYLLRAARFHGERSPEHCPVCRADSMSTVTYAYGDCFRAEANGRARATREIAELATQLPDFTVFVVEVCVACKWNHLLTSYVLGTGEALKRRARS